MAGEFVHCRSDETELSFIHSVNCKLPGQGDTAKGEFLGRRHVPERSPNGCLNLRGAYKH